MRICHPNPVSIASWLGIVTLGLVACQSAPPVATQQPAAAQQVARPSGPTAIVSTAWINQPPADTAVHIHAVGSGADLELARGNALAELGAKLSLRLASTYTDQTEVRQQSGSEAVSRISRLALRAEVGQIDLSAYELVRNARQGDTVYALIRIERAIVERMARARLNQALTSIEDTLATPPADDAPFARMQWAGQLRPASRAVQTATYLLIGLNAAVDADTSLARAAAADRAWRAALRGITFRIQTDPTSRALGDMIGRSLREAGASVVLQGGDPSQILIQISTAARQTEEGGRHVVRLRSELSIRDSHALYFRESWDSAASAALSRQAARTAADTAMLDQMRGTAALALLGFSDEAG
jgi:hypothetical protein